jgi:hypothetical protein
LAAALQGLDEHLQEIEPLPELESSDLQEWLDELDSTLPQDAWLGGWSWVACSLANWRHVAVIVAAAADPGEQPVLRRP